ncbi:two component regulator with propeller domain [Mucilaginibacter oryzae]|uniref:Two component regulator with propeller domain n=1 Tax=Mucilaginibacter oryzae TaxID=468058 RepID=A0A316HFE6_9SPHI|nr:two-component regulator propeller domain-containing protein [Mucilaginibacter oryzae]PWK79216.1 two component regulator with propeller domain [Mucilaginibacter oryzae]
MKKCILFILVLRAFICTSTAQNTLGTPTIKNYTHNEYNGGSEIWDIKQGKNGLLYLANEEGLLSFDGSYWKTYPLPNRSAIKSVAIDSAGRIYVGGQDEVGYFFPNQAGILKYHSLKQLLPQKARQFADIWDIVIHHDEVFFRTIECIFELKNNVMRTFDAPGGWMMLHRAGGRLFAHDQELGLVEFKDTRWQACIEQPTANIRVTGITEFNRDSLLVTTRKHGLFFLTGTKLYKAPTAIDAALRTDLVNLCEKISNNRYAIGTAAKGLFIIDNKGNLIEQFSNKQGLQNNNIHSLLLDSDHNLWIGLENGLDFVNYNTSVKHIYPNRENEVKSNAVSIFNNKLYIGTSNGLYVASVNPQQKDISMVTGAFAEVENTRGQVMSLTQIGGHLLAGHQDGVLQVNNNVAKAITPGPGAWMLKAFPASPDIVAGTYTGFQLLKYNNANFSFEGKIDGIYESLGNLALDNSNQIWATHPYRGIFKVQLSANKKKVSAFTRYSEKNGLPSALNNHVYFIKGRIIAATEKGVYEYDANKDTFGKSPFYKPIFADARVEYLTEDDKGNVWFISNQRVGVIDFSKKPAGKPYTVIYFPELAGQTVKGAEYIYPHDQKNIFIGSNNGVFHLNYRQYVSSENKLNVLLTSVKAIAEKDSVIFGGYFVKGNQITSAQSAEQMVSLSNQWSSFHFEYTSTLYAQKSNVEFTYKLIGFDQEWSKWSVKTEKDYTNLPYGTYTFSVRARNNLGAASAPVNYAFIVEPAWYQTIWAYIAYFAIFACMVYIGIKYQQKRFELQRQKHEEEQKRLSYLHSLELDRNDKEIMALKNDKLEAELNYKNKELATLTMQMVDRGKLMLNIKDELMVLIKKLNIPDASYQFRSVFKLLSDTEKNEGDWDNFALYFDQVHNNFLSTMKAKFPGLSSTDLKLCAYLRLNLSSKEIAQLLNISLKGVEISRYRVRKKLQLSTETNLYDFLIEVTK